MLREKSDAKIALASVLACVTESFLVAIPKSRAIPNLPTIERFVDAFSTLDFSIAAKMDCLRFTNSYFLPSQV